MNPNPFGIPDFNALGSGNNPLLRSMDMMAQAWKNMASGGAGDVSSGMMPSLSPDDLDRRIRDLRAVESWLQLNLSMLSTTIQGLEIQRSTLAAIKTMAQQGTQAAGGKNPFEAFMAFNPMAAGAAAAESAAGVSSTQPGVSQPETAAQTAFQQASAQPQQASPQPDAAANQDSPKDKQPGAQQDAGAGNPAAQAWWNMLQQQFDAMATATAASMQQVENYRQQATKAKAAGSAKPPKPAAADAQTSAKTSAPATAKPVKPAAKAATKTAAKAATKTAAKKTATRSTKSSTKKTDRPT
ncbi:PhaM family polyhydroxyalkanoate granule multifunctional regulatory protein [Alcaligenes aquatilis]|uniref:PhaM family polyhydroxyalkanoate granule multifunctional regulatory protein n=1 Tax=Alcaligenes aquatilis TaxID=323284 RepID=UPI0038735425